MEQESAKDINNQGQKILDINYGNPYPAVQVFDC